MSYQIRLTSLVIASLITLSVHAQTREIAITIDDLPFVGSARIHQGQTQQKNARFLEIVDTLVNNQVPATGFVIAGAIAKGQWELLELFHQKGFTIGNHSQSHFNLNRSNAEQYINDVDLADKRLRPLMTQNKYYRYPYLAYGHGEKKQAVEAYLASNHYVIAPVTIDSKDFKFNKQLTAKNWRVRAEHLVHIKKQYLTYIWKETQRAEKMAGDKPIKQILLIHANLLNSHALNDIIQLYRNNGYRFISLDEALSADAVDTIGVEA